MDRIEFEGLEIAFERSGAGPLVVLLHGGLSDGREWSRQIEALVADFTVVAYRSRANASS